jgi:pyruvate/2-oxoglutarate dehydrogenase complex dihydrolipoamide acyltransferase (E2) component
MAMGRKSDAYAAWKQAMHIGGDIDVYRDIMAQFGAGGSAPASANGATPATAPAAKASAPRSAAAPKPAPPPAKPAPAAPAALRAAPPPRRAADYDADDLVEPAGALTLSAGGRAVVDPDNPMQVAALAAANNLITHGIGNATVDQQIGPLHPAAPRRTPPHLRHLGDQWEGGAGVPAGERGVRTAGRGL